MKRWYVAQPLAFATFALCGLLLVAPRAPAQEKPKPEELPKSEEKLPQAEDIIDRSIEALGGRATLDKIHTRILKGTIEIEPQSTKGIFTAYSAAPNKSYELVEFEGGGKEEAGTDGEVYWSISTTMGPRLLEGEEKAEKARETTFTAELHWRKLFRKAECVATVVVDDHPCYKVVFTPTVGSPVTLYYDRKTHLPVKQEMTLTSPMGKVALTRLFEDYRKCDGVMINHRLTTLLSGTPVKQVVVLESVEQDKVMPTDRFTLPVSIQELAAKSKSESKPDMGGQEKNKEPKPAKP